MPTRIDTMVRLWHTKSLKKPVRALFVPKNVPTISYRDCVHEQRTATLPAGCQDLWDLGQDTISAQRSAAGRIIHAGGALRPLCQR